MQYALVTGGSGFIGGALIKELRARGFGVRALMRQRSERSHLKGIDYEDFMGDLSDPKSLHQAVGGMDYVFHLAGVVSAPDEAMFNKHNAQGCKNIAEAILANGKQVKRVVYVSSVAAVGPAPSETPLSESAAPRPISAYGRSKLLGEKYLEETLGDIPLSILRPPPVYGPRDKGIYQFIKVVNKGIVPVLRGKTPSGDKYFSFIYVDDLVNMIIASALGQGLGHREIYNAVGDDIYTWNEIMSHVQAALGKKRYVSLPVSVGLLSSVATIADFLHKITGKTFELTKDKVSEMVPDYYVYSNQKARNSLNFVEQTKLPDGMKKTVAWYRENGWL
jgi:nucleoside-diphosphate-sugar epimerase